MSRRKLLHDITPTVTASTILETPADERLYAVSMFGLAALALVVPGISNRLVVAGCLAAMSPSAVIARRLAPRQHAGTALAVAMMLATHLLVAVEASVWANGLLANTVLVVVSAGATTPRMTPLTTLLALGPIGVVGAVRQPTNWVALYTTAFLLSLVFSRLVASQRRQALRLEQQLRRVLDAAGVAIHDVELGPGGRVASIVGPIERMTGWTNEQWQTIDHRTLIHPDDLQGYWLHRNLVGEREVFDRTARFRRTDGSYAWLRDVSELHDQDGSTHLAGLTIDVSAVSEALATARRRARYDHLTGLANRSTVMAELARHAAEGDDVALLVLDVNDFKRINDTLGHAAGDRVLVATAERLTTLFGTNHLVGRLGGDEFAIVVNEANIAEPVAVWADLAAAHLEPPIGLDGLTVSARASIGVVRSAEHRVDADLLLRWADIAMYEAKRLGIRVCVFDDELKQSSIEDLVLAADIPRAIDEGEFIAYFQPQVDLRTGAIIGAEALARWHHPRLGLLSADRFMDLVRVSDSFEAFTSLILSQTIAAQAACRAAGLELDLSANISARSLLDRRLADRLSRLCSRYGVPTSSITIELTEDEMMDTDAGSEAALRALVAAGLRVSIDDFGTGYSSFSRLSDLTFDEVKLDRSFLASSTHSERSCEVIGSITALAHRLGNRVVAEGVERREHAEALAALGCDVGQGFLYGPAMPLADFLIEARRPRITRLRVAPPIADVRPDTA